MIILIIALIISLILCGIFLYIAISNRKVRIEIDTKREQYNNELASLSSKLEIQTKNLKDNINILENNINYLNIKLEDKQHQLNESTKFLTQSIAANTTAIEEAKAQAERSFELEAEQLSEQSRKNQQEAKDAYIAELQDISKDFQAQMEKFVLERQKCEEELNKQKSIVDAAIAANKRAEEEKMKQKFYQIQIPMDDSIEILELRSVGEKLRDPAPLNKVIWKVYYEKPTNDLLGRVVGNNRITGIYKITNQINGKCYVGQAVDIAARWKQHIKRALGAEEPTKNKLYPAMSAYGIENFSFEIIEECPATVLNEQEDYWQDYFQAKEFGYSIK